MLVKGTIQKKKKVAFQSGERSENSPHRVRLNHWHQGRKVEKSGDLNTKNTKTHGKWSRVISQVRQQMWEEPCWRMNVFRAAGLPDVITDMFNIFVPTWFKAPMEKHPPCSSKSAVSSLSDYRPVALIPILKKCFEIDWQLHFLAQHRFVFHSNKLNIHVCVSLILGPSLYFKCFNFV